jgi:hypothetical protein
VTNITVARQRFGKHRLKAGRVEPERMSVAEQRLGNYVPAATHGSKSLNTVSAATDNRITEERFGMATYIWAAWKL